MTASMRHGASLLLLAALVGFGALMARADVEAPQPRAVKGEQCVEPTEVMRRDHMDLLKHQRDDTMLRGIRTERHSLVGCINCHADKNAQGVYIPVNDEGQFCQECHSYTAVKLDCFQCHSTVPVEADGISAHSFSVIR